MFSMSSGRKLCRRFTSFVVTNGKRCYILHSINANNLILHDILHGKFIYKYKSGFNKMSIAQFRWSIALHCWLCWKGNDGGAYYTSICSNKTAFNEPDFSVYWCIENASHKTAVYCHRHRLILQFCGFPCQRLFAFWNLKRRKTNMHQAKG